MSKVDRSMYTSEGGFHQLESGHVLRVTGGCRGSRRRQQWELKTDTGWRVLEEPELTQLLKTNRKT